MTDAVHPYKSLENRAFWNRHVQNVPVLEIGQWYRRKFEIGAKDRIATAGSCFGQQIGRELKSNGFRYLDVEPPPPLLPRHLWLENGYGIYSARYGNIYTTRQLLQLAQRALGEFAPRERPWPRDGGFVDPFRPTLEARPFEHPDDVEAMSRFHLARVAMLFERTDVFVFTLGLTETWVSREDGAVFPVAPGVAGGGFDAQRHGFLNLTHADCLADLRRFVEMMRAVRPRMRFILTVSPVSMMATASGHQVIVASTYSKSVLRAVAGEMADTFDFIDYFPGYEIITSPVMGGQFYDDTRRTVGRRGIEFVMAQFFAEHLPPPKPMAEEAAAASCPDEAGADESHCDEDLLATLVQGAAP